MKAKLFLVVFAGCAFLAAAQQSVQVDWVEGTVERMVGSAWRAVDIGDSFGTDTTLRLAKGASAELSSGGVHVRLMASGTYKLTDAFAKAKGGSPASDTAAKIAKLAGKGDYNLVTATTAGVRGTAQDGVRGSAADMSWDEGRGEADADAPPALPPDPYEGVVALYKEKSYTESSRLARDLRLTGGPAAAFRSAYWEAASFYAQGLALPAIRTLEKTAPDPAAPEYRDADFLAARIWMELSEWKNAVTAFGRFTAAPIQDPKSAEELKDRQMALILSSACFDNLKKKADSRKALEAALALDPASDLGKEAAARLK